MRAFIYYLNWGVTGVPGNATPQPGEFYDCVAAVEVPDEWLQVEATSTDSHALAWLFQEFNIGKHGGENIRAMSVGDVVAFSGDDFGNGRCYICAPTGWRSFEHVLNNAEDFGSQPERVIANVMQIADKVAAECVRPQCPRYGLFENCVSQTCVYRSVADVMRCKQCGNKKADEENN